MNYNEVPISILAFVCFKYRKKTYNRIYMQYKRQKKSKLDKIYTLSKIENDNVRDLSKYALILLGLMLTVHYTLLAALATIIVERKVPIDNNLIYKASFTMIFFKLFSSSLCTLNDVKISVIETIRADLGK